MLIDILESQTFDIIFRVALLIILVRGSIFAWNCIYEKEDESGK